ncbi:MAG: hypothetical protein MJE77_16245 [Proteobacteria bacterium]|nr:hypothetical protein [Pseudomonadota bacterium]
MQTGATSRAIERPGPLGNQAFTVEYGESEVFGDHALNARRECGERV